ncbi:SIMPL domain-containing protein, partial [Chloroflexota bacterium]
SGEGKVTMVPEIALLDLGIEVEAATVEAAQQQAREAMERVMKVLKSEGVAERDIKTQSFSISPVYSVVREDTRQWEITGYRVSNRVSAKIREIDNVGSIIDAAAKAGGDVARIDSLSFTVDDPSKYYDEAREKALLDAMARAKQIAKVADIRLGKPLYISESTGYIPLPRPAEFRTAVPEAGAALSTPISPGETEVRLTVQMAFGIK